MGMSWVKVNSFIISGPIDEPLVKEFFAYAIGLNTNSHSAYITINSQGGDEHCGRAIAGIITAIKSGGREVVIDGFGDIHSAAVLIFAAGTRRRLSKYANIMVHETSTEYEGNSSSMKAFAKQMEKDEQFWCNIMAELTGTDAKTWMKLHEDETYLTPKEALELNLATELI